MATANLGTGQKLFFVLERVSEIPEGGSLYWLHFGERSFVLKATDLAAVRDEAVGLLGAQFRTSAEVDWEEVLQELKEADAAPPPPIHGRGACATVN